MSEQEISLAEDKISICDDRDEEIDICASAENFHQMGLLYKVKSPDKISLIRSAALLNAAISRQPSNPQFKDDLQQFCTELLETAGAEKMDADLMQISNQAAQMIKEMRDTVQQALSRLETIPYDITIGEQNQLEVKKIHDIKLIQEQITQKYGDVMRYIAEKCSEIMGKKPCEFCIAAMGSLARSEVTPYSDFEHFVLLEDGVQNDLENYQEILEYFGWFSVIFKIIVINLKETVAPSIATQILNDAINQSAQVSQSDTSAKNADTKLWTTELIRPVSDMVKYLDSDTNSYDGVELCGVFRQTTFVLGNEEVYAQFTSQVKSVSQTVKESSHAALKEKLEEDLKKFSAFQDINVLNACLKQNVFCRFVTFVFQLGRLHSADEKSPFLIIQQLNASKTINDETARLFSYALAVSYQILLYLEITKRIPDGCFRENPLPKDDTCHKLTDILGEKSVVDYFIIVEKLQEVLRRHYLHCDITIEPEDKFRKLFVLGLYDRIVSEGEKYLESNLIVNDSHWWIQYHVACAHDRKQQYQESLAIWEKLHDQEIRDDWLKGAVMVNKGRCLLDMNRHREASLYAKRVAAKLQGLEVSKSRKYRWLSDLAYIGGWCKYEIGDYREAIKDYSQNLKYMDFVDERFDNYKQVNRARTHFNIATCLYLLGDNWSALTEAKKSLDICERHNLSEDDKSNCYQLLGCCCFVKSEFDKALEYFKTELELRQQFVLSEQQDSDEDIKIAIDNIQMCSDIVEMN
ncbi:unnamed protein product [Clavelina lepadiformis]|uniref:Protein-PII uridylyltransferase N-terminal domain-containing protein n=1 Tax=Clavelina lepadiformis TaxID=159417 RepID=A0ABP0GAN0_CLALP